MFIQELNLFELFDAFVVTMCYTIFLTLLTIASISFVLNFLTKVFEVKEEVITKISLLLNVITFVVLTFFIIYYNYTIPYYEKQKKIEYRDSQLSKLSKGELDCNLIYTDEDVYFELSKEEQLQYYTKCTVIQENK